ncbi:aldehyde ferredoxin oxidoreductase N-terminal domain-containing protein [Planctomycetota bacterium]
MAPFVQRALHVELGSGYYRTVRVSDPTIIGPVDYGLREASRRGSLVIGAGPFAGSVLPGSNRLIVTGISPAWGGFYVSTMGGAALVFDNLGINYLVLEGRARDFSVLKLLRVGGEEIQVTLEPVDLGAVWAGYGGDHGQYALQAYVFERYGKDYPSEPRILATGPAALRTDFGAIGSAPIVRGQLSHVDTWAGRGGLGSRMVQEHRVAAIIFGGSFIDEDLRDRRLADQYFLSRYQMRMMLKDKEATTKYRYDPALETGGTFGVNYKTLGTRLLAFNYRSIAWPAERRLEVYERLVADHYLKQYQEETIHNKRFRHCGEPCPAVCKKMRDRFKKDYEPYQTLGPLCGIFDQRAAEKLNRHCDAQGFDAIQVGGVVAWIMDLLDEGLLLAEDLGLSSEPVFCPEGFDAVSDSARNAALGCEIADLLLDTSGRFRPFLKGAREVAKKLGNFEDPRYVDRLVFTAAGAEGWMVPNQYWTPGVLAPMAIMGKYYQYYGDDFLPPRTLGRVSADRMVAELTLDNCGFCRFHRSWAEELIGEIFNSYYGLEVDFAAHHRNLARRLNSRNGSVFWESERTVDLISTFLERKLEEGTERPELGEWLDRFQADKWDAARDFWYEVRKGIDDVLNDRPGR